MTIRFPGRIKPDEEDKTLCDRLFYGMKGELKNGVRHLYNSPDITFGELLNKARRVKLEDNETKGPVKVQTKRATLGETSPLTKLQQQVGQLTTLVKSVQTDTKKGSSLKSSTRKNDNQNNNQVLKDNAGSDPRKRSKGPETGPNGPFEPGQRPIQCYKCKGWGPPRCLCPSRLNFTRGGTIRENPPPVQTSAEVANSTPQNEIPQPQQS